MYCIIAPRYWILIPGVKSHKPNYYECSNHRTEEDEKFS